MNQELNATTSPAILERLAALTPESQPVWGKMDVGQMLAHCQVALEIAIGETTMKRGLIGLLFGRLALRSVMKEKPFAQNMPTAPVFKVTDAREFAKERDRLCALISTYVDRGPEALAESHPFFGAMTPETWGVLQWKHLDHHLRQFGG